MIALALAAPIPNRSRRRVSASAALRLIFGVGCSLLSTWAATGTGASGLADGAAKAVTDRLVRTAKTREDKTDLRIRDAP